MDQEQVILSETKMIVDEVLAELLSLEKSLHYTPGTNTISSASTSTAGRTPTRYNPHYSCQGSGIVSAQIHLNPKYISKIFNSPRKASEIPLRMRPYYVPERSRTKSENLDTSTGAFQETLTIVTDSLNSDGQLQTSTTNSTINSLVMSSTMDTCSTSASSVSNCISSHHSFVLSSAKDAPGVVKSVRLKKIGALKKSKSLEDVRAEALDGSQLSHEMEFVSSRIQKLKVQE